MRVEHKSLGKGTVVGFDGDYLRVTFDTYLYPSYWDYHEFKPGSLQYIKQEENDENRKVSNQ